MLNYLIPDVEQKDCDAFKQLRDHLGPEVAPTLAILGKFAAMQVALDALVSEYYNERVPRDQELVHRVNVLRHIRVVEYLMGIDAKAAFKPFW